VERRFLSPREVSQYTGLHLMTIYSMIARGEIPSARLGRRVLIDKQLLDARLLETQGQAASVGDGRGVRR
jgi:excisionase family DNA binding protein